jgi:hypothetical protein
MLALVSSASPRRHPRQHQRGRPTVPQHLHPSNPGWSKVAPCGILLAVIRNVSRSSITRRSRWPNSISGTPPSRQTVVACGKTPMLVSVDPSRERIQSTCMTFKSLLSTAAYVSSSELCTPTYLCFHISNLVQFLYILKKAKY